MNTWTVLISVALLLVFNVAFSQAITYKRTDEGIVMKEKGKAVLFYQVKPKTVDGKYERSGYVHPLYSLNGTVLTEDMPEDHPYHRGIFWAWHQIIVNDKSVADGWTSENISFVPENVRVERSGKSCTIRSKLVWRVKDSANGSDTNVIDESAKITVRPATGNYRVIDFEIVLKPLMDNVKLGGSDDAKGYGGFCMRIKLPDDIRFISGDKDVTPADTALEAGPWMNFKMSDGGIILMGHRDGGERSSFPWILRKSKSMQNVPYPGRTPVKVAGEGLHLHYRVVVHNNHITDDEINTLYKDFKK